MLRISINNSYLMHGGVPVDGPEWRELLRANDVIAFEDGQYDVNFGLIRKGDGGFWYEFRQGGVDKLVWYHGDYIDFFVVDYYFKIFASSEYGDRDIGDNLLYIPIRKRYLGTTFFEGYFGFRADKFMPQKFRKIMSDFLKCNPGARIAFETHNGRTIDPKEFFPKHFKQNQYGTITNIYYSVTSDSKLDGYTCIKLDCLLEFFATGDDSVNEAFTQHWYRRENLFIG